VGGFYEARLTRNDGNAEVRRYAVNVDPNEGDLAAVNAEQLAARLDSVRYHYAQASQFQFSAADQPGYNLGEILLYLLVVLLIGEQVLAWSASYHPFSRRNMAAHGGAA
jgi:hypothetical protein